MDHPATDPVAVAARLFDAIERGDIETVADCFADDAIIWHNTDQQESSKARTIELMAGYIQAIGPWRYTNRRAHVFDGGFVQQHLLCRAGPDGKESVTPFCVVGSVRDGRITRIDEYFDSRQSAAPVIPEQSA